MSGMFNPDGTPDVSQIQNMSQDEIMNLIATQKASAGKQNPYSVMSQAMQMQQQKMQGQAPAPQIRRGQAPNILAPYDEIMKLQQMQQMKRPQSLI
jgi:hypothetical protein